MKPDMRKAVREARSFLATVEGLNSVPGLMTSHDRGKECMARALVAIAGRMDALRALESASTPSLQARQAHGPGNWDILGSAGDDSMWQVARSVTKPDADWIVAACTAISSMLRETKEPKP